VTEILARTLEVVVIPDVGDVAVDGAEEDVQPPQARVDLAEPGGPSRRRLSLAARVLVERDSETGGRLVSVRVEPGIDESEEEPLSAEAERRGFVA
jgi:hypothetical protein